MDEDLKIFTFLSGKKIQLCMLVELLTDIIEFNDYPFQYL